MDHRTIGVSFEKELRTILLESTRLSDLYQSRDPGFISGLQKWLIRSEALLKQHDRAEASELAGIRIRVTSIERGNSENGRASNRKVRLGQLAQLLPAAQEVLQRVLYRLQERLEKAREVVGQVVGIGFEVGLIQQMSFESGSDNAKLNALASALSQLEHTRNGVIQVKMLVTYVDLLVLLDQSIDAVLEKAPVH